MGEVDGLGGLHHAGQQHQQIAAYTSTWSEHGVCVVSSPVHLRMVCSCVHVKACSRLSASATHIQSITNTHSAKPHQQTDTITATCRSRTYTFYEQHTVLSSAHRSSGHAHTITAHPRVKSHVLPTAHTRSTPTHTPHATRHTQHATRNTKHANRNTHPCPIVPAAMLRLMCATRVALSMTAEVRAYTLWRAASCR